MAARPLPIWHETDAANVCRKKSGGTDAPTLFPKIFPSAEDDGTAYYNSALAGCVVLALP